MQLNGRGSEPLTPLGQLLFLSGICLALLAVVRYCAGGWGGLVHRRLRGPLFTMTLFAALGAMGRWLVDQQHARWASEHVGGVGGALVVCCVIGFLAALMVTWSRFTTRWRDASRITSELTVLLDDDRAQFHAERHLNIHRPLELLEELTELIGPGSWAPGHEWATHQWIADRIAAARSIAAAEWTERSSET